MSSGRHYDQDKDSTLYVGNLDERVTDAIVWELMNQAGPVVNVHLPKDRVTQIHQGYGFVEFASERDADYAAKIVNQIRVWGKPVRVNKASADRRGLGGVDANGAPGQQGVGAELFVGSLDSMVDEKMLFETFSRFGPLVAPPKISRDDANLSKGFGFISYASFEASDDAIANMNGQYLMNKEVTIQYAYKKDGKGERHGDAAERALAAQAKKHGMQVNIPAMPASLVMPNAPAQPAPRNSSYPVQSPAMQPPPQPAQMPYDYTVSYGYQNMPPPPQIAEMPYDYTGKHGYHNMAQPPPAPHLTQFPGPPLPYGTYPAGTGPSRPPQFISHPAPLQAPPTAAGLPARPPPSIVRYGN